MIKFRLNEKFFYRADSFMWELSDFEEIPTFEIVRTSRYKNQKGVNTLSDKKLIKRYFDDLNNNEYNYITENHYPEDDTEYLDQLSDPRPGGRLVYSKRLSGDDRFCYIINYPKKVENSNEYKIIIEVYSSIGHTRPDGGSYWSPDFQEMRKIKQEINQWRRKRGLQEI